MRKKFFSALVLALVIAAALAYWVAERGHGIRDIREAVPVKRFQLSNGLTVVVMPNDRVPAVTELIVVKAGAADDPYGKSGLAHYLEHLMFTGTKENPEGVYDKAIARVGGAQNAYTTRDYTLFFATVAKEKLPMVLAMEADRLQRLEFNGEHASRELKVITEERAVRVDANAAAQLAEQMNAITFLNHPYRHPTIGWAEDMATFTAADAKAFFEAHYRASNLVVVLAGDITEREARRYAQKYYGRLPAGAAPARNWPKEPPLRMVRHAEMNDPKTKEPRLIRQYLAPSAGEGSAAQSAALELYAQYLGGGPTSLLYETLVRDQKLASDVGADYDGLSIGPALFRIEATPAPGVALARLEEALDAAIVRSIQAPDEATLARARTQLKAEMVYAQDGLETLAHLVGQLYAIGLDETYFYDWPLRLQAADAAAVSAAAKVVLAPERRITGTLLPPAPPTEVSHVP
jgi:zinc protease